MSDQIQIRVDSRVFYGLMAVVAVIAVLGLVVLVGRLGYSLGQDAGGDTESPMTAYQENAVPTAPPVQNPQTQGQFEVAAADSPVQQVAKGGNPVSVDEIAVGEAEPRLWIEELSEENNFTWDFGEIPATQAVEKEFTIANVGTSELVIQDASASCGCAAAVVEDPNLGAGESTTIRVSYDPRVNKEQGRFVQKQVRIRSNDPLVQLVEFTITADVASQ